MPSDGMSPGVGTRIRWRVRDLLWLGKPGIALFCVLVTLGTAILAAGSVGLAAPVLLPLLVGTALTVLSAGGLNMVLERRPDRAMARTRNRPVAAGRIGVVTASAVAVAQGAAGLALLYHGTSLETAGLAALALFTYLVVYTPLKYRTRYAAAVGTLPGAVPALMGWTAVRGDLGAPAWVVFAILVLWQLPHTLAITVRHRREYEAAGVPTVPSVLGEEPARLHAFLWTGLLFSVSLLLVPMGVAGSLYFLVASGVGGWLVYLGVRGLEPAVEKRWARRFFVASVVYVPVLTVGLMLDRWAR